MARDTRIQALFGIDSPIIQAPMAGAQGAALAIAVSRAGGLGSLGCALLSPDQVRSEAALVRGATGGRPFNLNFFAHTMPELDPLAWSAWQTRLDPYYAEFGIEPSAPPPGAARAPFDDMYCRVLEEVRPDVVSFHFGLPAADLVARVKATGAKLIASATYPEEARWLEAHGCDAIIAQGAEAGGHRGIFLSDDLSTQVGTMALVPRVVDAVSVPVIAAGGISDARGIAAALILGASAVQLGTAYLRTPEATIGPLHREALEHGVERPTAITNVLTGRPARSIVNRAIREIGPISDVAAPFPNAAAAIVPLRAKAEQAGRDDFTSLWAGQAAALAVPAPAEELTRRLMRDALALLGE